MVKIYFVRHGESVANTQGIYQGQTYNTPLSSLGRLQARALAEHSAMLGLERVIASPLRRTWETAAYVGEANHISVESEMRIIETNHGQWEGRHKLVIGSTWPDLYHKWNRFPSRVQFPGGEHFLHTQKRVVSWWKEFMKLNQKTTLVVTHDNIVRIVVAHILKTKLNRIWKFHLHPAALTAVMVAGGQASITYINEGRYLEAVRTDVAVHAL